MMAAKPAMMKGRIVYLRLLDRRQSRRSATPAVSISIKKPAKRAHARAKVGTFSALKVGKAMSEPRREMPLGKCTSRFGRPHNMAVRDACHAPAEYSAAVLALRMLPGLLDTKAAYGFEHLCERTPTERPGQIIRRVE